MAGLSGSQLRAWALDQLFIKQPKLRRVVTRMLYGSSPVSVPLFGAELLIHSELENGYLRAFRHSRSLSLFRDEASVLINLASLIEDDCTFLDIGANIGIYSAVISRLGRVKKDLAVFAFEVDPQTFRRLSENARRHGFRAENVALAEAEKQVQFVRGAVSHVTTALESRNRYNIKSETFAARCLPLSAFDIPGSSIVMKIDVEGGEYEVLLGARRFFAERRVKAVYFDGVSKLKEAQAFLAEFGFRLLDGQTLQPFKPGMFSLLALRPL
jgi:FkbM family methyltransferase